MASGLVSEAQVHDKLALHGLTLEERDAWWKEPLPELGYRTPASMFSTDPVAVKLLAEIGAIADRKRFSILTPKRLWPDQDIALDASGNSTDNSREHSHDEQDAMVEKQPVRDPGLPEWWS